MADLHMLPPLGFLRVRERPPLFKFAPDVEPEGFRQSFVATRNYGDSDNLPPPGIAVRVLAPDRNLNRMKSVFYNKRQMYPACTKWRSDVKAFLMFSSLITMKLMQSVSPHSLSRRAL